MSLVRKIAQNTLYQAAGRVIATILAVFIIALITRYLGPERFGNFTTIVTFLQFFGIVIDFGLMLITVQMMSEPNVNEKKLLSNLFTIRFFSAFIILAFAPIVILFFPYPDIVKFGVLAAVAYFFFIALNQIFIGFLQKKYRGWQIAFSEILGRIVFFINVIVVIHFDLGLYGIIGAITVGTIVNVVSNFIFSQKFSLISFAFDWEIWKNIFSKSWPIAIGIILNLVYLKADTLILALYHSQSDVGIYGAPYRVLEILLGFPLIFILFIIPTLTSTWIKKDHKGFFTAMQKAFDALSIMTIPLVVGTWILADSIMTFVSGMNFIASGNVLRVIILATGILFLGQLFGHAIVAIGKQKQTLWVYFLGALSALGIYFAIIPTYSYMGAAWATVIVEAMVNTILFIILWRYTKFWPHFGIFFRSLIASVIMGFVLITITWQHVIIAVIVGSVLYFVICYSIGGIHKNMIREIFLKEKRNLS